MTVTRSGMMDPEVQSWAMEDEIDLRQYVDVLVRWWREIVLLAVVAAAVAAVSVLGMRLLVPKKYEASATVAIARTKSDITFDPKFVTLSEAAQMQSAEANSRRAALLGLVSNGAVAEAVISELGDLLTDQEKVPANLLDQVSGSAGSQNGSDLIQISVTADSPEKAATIANAWAHQYVDQVNVIYGQVPTELLGTVESELTGAQSKYETAQKNLEDFVANNQISRLNRMIAEKQANIDSIQSGRKDAMDALVQQVVKSRQEVVSAYLDAQAKNQLSAFTKEEEGKRAMIEAYLDALNQARFAVFDNQVKQSIQQLQDYYSTRLKVTKLLDDAISLRQQVQSGGTGAADSNALALQLLKAQVFASSASLPGSLQVQANPAAPQSPEQMQADLDGLIKALQDRITALDTQIDGATNDLLSGNNYTHLDQSVPADSALVQEIKKQYPDLFVPGQLSALGADGTADNPLVTAGQQKAADLLQLQGLENLPSSTATTTSLDESIAALENEILGLQAQLETENAKQRQLTQQRDLAWSTYTTLSNKVAELHLSSTAASSEVRFAAPAIPPVGPVKGPSLIMTTALAGMVGLMLAIFVAFFANFMEQEPFLGSRKESAVA